MAPLFRIPRGQPKNFIPDRDGKRTCRACGIEKDLATEFRGNGKHRTCNKCLAANAKFIRQQLVDAGAYKRPWVHPDSNFRYTHSMTREEYDARKAAQDHKCAICGREQGTYPSRRGDGTKLVLDHNHETGQLRGMLCRDCNFALGYVHESVETAQRMMDYIHKWNEPSATDFKPKEPSPKPT